MGKLTDNLMMDTVTGKVGKQVVFRNWHGATVVAGRPKKNPDRVFTDVQVKIQKKFRSASNYAKLASKDPVTGPLYAAGIGGKKYSAFMVAMSDFLNAPTVEEIDTTAYKGAIGDVILVSATDDFKVVRVLVSILSAAGDVLESGEAVEHPVNADEWSYKATAANAALAGTQIQVTAFDTPGGKGFLEKAL